MNPQIPIPESIPAPAWLFHVLGMLLFALHILTINVLIGGTFIALASRLRMAKGITTLTDAVSRKLPVFFAVGITLGVAPLLFLQVIYGSLFYTSSILLGEFWILVIPAIILGYYAAYVHAHAVRRLVATAAIGATALVVLYVAFMLVNNNLLLMQPSRWAGYFTNPNGTLLDLPDPTLVPRYFHFLTASVAVAGLASAWIWNSRGRRGTPGSDTMVERGLYVFGIATIVQIVVGLWFVFSLRKEFLMQFVGGDLVATIILWAGFFFAVGALTSAFARRIYPTLVLLAFTLVAMILTRDTLRLMYLNGVLDTGTLHIHPQYTVLFLFVVILLIGLGAVGWMLKAGFRTSSGRTAP